MTDPTFQSTDHVAPRESWYSILGLPSFSKGIATADNLSGIPKDPPVKTHGVGRHHDLILFGSRIAAVEEPDWICEKIISSALQMVCFTNLAQITYFEFVEHIFATAGRVKFDQFVFGRNRFVVGIAGGLLNQAQESGCWPQNYKRYLFASRHHRIARPVQELQGQHRIVADDSIQLWRIAFGSVCAD
jgi:hypothetical protein